RDVVGLLARVARTLLVLLPPELALALRLGFAPLALLGFLLCARLGELHFLEIAQFDFAARELLLLALPLRRFLQRRFAQLAFPSLLREAILFALRFLHALALDALFLEAHSFGLIALDAL